MTRRSSAMLLLAVLLAGLGTQAAARPLPGAEGPEGVPIRSVSHSGPGVWRFDDLLRSMNESLGQVAKAARLAVKGGPTCMVVPMDCNSTVTGTLQVTDCDLGDGTFVDFWVFDGTDGDQVTINLSSSDFDTYLGLLDPTPELVAQDDDSGGGTNSRIVYMLDDTGTWAIAVNSAAITSGDPGDYVLSLDCGGTATPPAAPSNLTATAVSATDIDLFWDDNSNNEDDFEVQARTGGASFQSLGTVPADSAGAAVSNLQPDTSYSFRVRARNSAGNSAFSNVASATTDTAPPPGGDCVPDATTMCLNEGRFQVEVDWRDFNSNTGQAQVVPFGSDDSGLFFFFSADNWEMLVKVLNGCSITDHYWVFAAATTNVEYTLRVTDTERGVVKQFFNPLGVASPSITDTSAFATCP